MKIKTSMIDIVRRYDVVFRCGYCDLQHIMSGCDPTFYNCGVYGWNCDIYTEYLQGRSIAITTGYRNMRGERIPSEILKKYSDIAKNIRDSHDWTKYKEMSEKLEENRQNFFEELLKIA